MTALQSFEAIARAAIHGKTKLAGILEIRRVTNLSIADARALSDHIRTNPSSAPVVPLPTPRTPQQEYEQEALRICKTVQEASQSKTEFELKIIRIKELRDKFKGLGLVQAKTLIERASGLLNPPIVPLDPDPALPIIQSTLTLEQQQEAEALKVCATITPNGSQSISSIKIPRIKELRNRVPGLGLAEAKTLIERATGEVHPPITAIQLLSPFNLDGQTLFELTQQDDSKPWSDMGLEEQTRFNTLAQQIDDLYQGKTLSSTFDPFEL